MIKKFFSLSENLFTKTAFLTFAFRSKCRVNKSTSCKKKDREKTNTPLRVVKNHDVPNNSRYRFAANKKNFSLFFFMNTFRCEIALSFDSPVDNQYNQVSINILTFLLFLPTFRNRFEGTQFVNTAYNTNHRCAPFQ